MELNTSLTNGEVSEAKKRIGSRAVYDFKDRLLCFWSKRKLYDLNGETIAEFERKETITIDEEKHKIRYYRAATRGEDHAEEQAEERRFSSDGKYVYDGEEIIGEKRIGRIEKRSYIVLVAILLGIILGLSGIFTLYAIITHRPPTPTPQTVTLTIVDKDGEWGAEGGDKAL